ncbi:MAG: magnesium transporter CorA family protein [Sphaerochaeta sp.]|uniref:magnesium transporter CorA family protein n=1 Tax=Sphaerochaeta sp. TaxID=1972642 RepID=UPI002FC99DE6
MITIRKNLMSQNPGDQIQEAPYTWVDARDINRDDITQLEEQYQISSELLADIMDQDEQARIEREDDYIALIVRLPALADDSKGINQYAVPLGIVLVRDTVITICQSNSIVLEDFAKNRYRQYPVQTMEGFVISILGRAVMVYIRLLKYINRQKSQVEEQLHKSIMNYELIQLLQIQKSLVYFSTSLTTNEALLERLQRTPYFKLASEEERDFLEDVITDNKQAIEMANIYSSILTGTMDAFASVISNNMNVIMKRLTIISISIMFPTFVTGFYGMNVELPFMHNSFAWMGVLTFCGISAFIGGWMLSDRRNARLVQRSVSGSREMDREKQRKKRKKRALPD